MFFKENNAMTAQALPAELRRRACIGKEGAIWIRRDAESGTLQLRTGSQQLPILRLQLQLRSDAGICTLAEENFSGELFLDDRGEADETVRLSMVDDGGQTVLTSIASSLEGSVYIAALQDAAMQKVFCFSAVFQTRTDGSGRSAAMWDVSKDWLYFADLLSELIGGIHSGSL